MIDGITDTEDTIIVDGLALSFDPGGGLKKREAAEISCSQTAVSSSRTMRHGIMVDLMRR